MVGKYEFEVNSDDYTIFARVWKEREKLTTQLHTSDSSLRLFFLFFFLGFAWFMGVWDINRDYVITKS